MHHLKTEYLIRRYLNWGLATLLLLSFPAEYITTVSNAHPKCTACTSTCSSVLRMHTMPQVHSIQVLAISSCTCTVAWSLSWP